jgi:hypothetical protein
MHMHVHHNDSRADELWLLFSFPTEADCQRNYIQQPSFSIHDKYYRLNVNVARQDVPCQTMRQTLEIAMYKSNADPRYLNEGD